ncbi:MAG: hypothetical protein HKP58_07500 [Desulfatitalea sp.]|nr:hypothetical protein [Desulfatitalea sp.]NNK00244.1 hypothetical protein [Desulfatitalea sp.]
MENAKKEKIENQLRQLLNAASQEKDQNELPAPRRMGGIQVIRKRKGQPDQHIFENPCLN